MDVDRIKNASCYNCGKKGHFCQDCPDPKIKINVREMWEQLEEDEREDMYITVRAMRMADEDEDF
jgi:Zinc knuckle